MKCQFNNMPIASFRLIIVLFLFSCSLFKEKPVYLQINSIEIVSFPKYKSDGKPWDSDSPGPDLYVEIAVGALPTQNFVWSSNQYHFVNCDTVGNICFDSNNTDLPIRINELWRTLQVYVYDYDFDALDPFKPDDSLGGFQFTPDYTENHILLKDTKQQIEMRILFTWLY